MAPLNAFLALHVASFAWVALWDGSDWPALRVPRLALWIAAIVLLWVPLVVHTSVGIGLLFRGSGHVAGAQKPTLASRLTSVSGGVLLVFLSYHVFEYSVPLWTGELASSDLVPDLYRKLSATTGGVPWYSAGYLATLGMAAAHSGLGLWGALVAEAAPRPATQARVVVWACWSWSLSLFALGAASIVRMATGSILPW